MKKTKLTVKFTTQFRKDYKLAMKRGLRIALLEEVVERPAIGSGTGNATFSRTGC